MGGFQAEMLFFQDKVPILPGPPWQHILIHPISHTMRKFSNFRKMCQGWNVLQGISIAIKFKQQSTGSCDRDNSYTEMH